MKIKVILFFLICFAVALGAQMVSITPAFKIAADIQGRNNIIYTPLGSNATTTAALNFSNSANIIIHANTLALLYVGGSLASWVVPTNIDGSCGLTWVLVTKTNYNSAGMGMAVYRTMTNANSPSGRVRARYAASQTGHNMRVCEFTNVNISGTYGSGAIIQVAAGTNATANPSVTLGEVRPDVNAVVAFFANVANGFTGTPKTDWTEDWDSGYNSPATGAYEEYILRGENNTPSVTANAQQWGGIAIGIKSSRSP
jgi:hypothetical protein